MSFPLIRPTDVEHMPFRTLELLRQALAAECQAAARRHQEILQARELARLAATLPEPEPEARQRRDELVGGPPSPAVLSRRPRAGMDPEELLAARDFNRDYMRRWRAERPTRTAS